MISNLLTVGSPFWPENLILNLNLRLKVGLFLIKTLGKLL